MTTTFTFKAHYTNINYFPPRARKPRHREFPLEHTVHLQNIAASETQDAYEMAVSHWERVGGSPQLVGKTLTLKAYQGSLYVPYVEFGKNPAPVHVLDFSESSTEHEEDERFWSDVFGVEREYYYPYDFKTYLRDEEFSGFVVGQGESEEEVKAALDSRVKDLLFIDDVLYKKTTVPVLLVSVDERFADVQDPSYSAQDHNSFYGLRLEILWGAQLGKRTSRSMGGATSEGAVYGLHQVEEILNLLESEAQRYVDPEKFLQEVKDARLSLDRQGRYLGEGPVFEGGSAGFPPFEVRKDRVEAQNILRYRLRDGSYSSYVFSSGAAATDAVLELGVLAHRVRALGFELFDPVCVSVER